MTPINLYECTPHCDFEKAISPRRAVFLCGVCRRDYSMEYLLYMLAAQHEPPERIAKTEAEIDALYDKLGGSPKQPTFNESKLGRLK